MERSRFVISRGEFLEKSIVKTPRCSLTQPIAAPFSGVVQVETPSVMPTSGACPSVVASVGTARPPAEDIRHMAFGQGRDESIGFDPVARHAQLQRAMVRDVVHQETRPCLGLAGVSLLESEEEACLAENPASATIELVVEHINVLHAGAGIPAPDPAPLRNGANAVPRPNVNGLTNTRPVAVGCGTAPGVEGGDTARLLGARTLGPPATPGGSLEPYELAEEQMRFTQSELRGRTDRRQRGTRGNGIEILGGELLVDSSLYHAAILRARAPNARVFDRRANDQLYEHLLAVSKRDSTWIVVHGGSAGDRRKDYAPGTMPPAILHALAVDACRLDSQMELSRERTMAQIDRQSHRVMWENYYRTCTNQIGMTLSQRVGLWWDSKKLGFGLSVARPPEE